MKITRLDRRHAGKIAFDYFIAPTETNHWENPLKMHEWRVWAWENFGPGAERDVAVRLYMNDTPVRFAWDCEHGHCRLYLKEEDLTFFKLKWG